MDDALQREMDSDLRPDFVHLAEDAVDVFLGQCGGEVQLAGGLEQVDSDGGDELVGEAKFGQRFAAHDGDGGEQKQGDFFHQYLFKLAVDKMPQD